MAGLKGQARLPAALDPRARRNAAGLATEAGFLFSGALALVNGVVTLNLGAVPSLDQTSGLVVALNPTTPSLTLAGGLALQIKAADSGLKVDGPGLYVDSAVYLAVATAASTYLTTTDAGTTYLTQANAGTTYVPLTRTISTTAPITGGGALSGNLTLVMAVATDAVDGYLTAADHTTFAGFSTKADYSFGANVFTGDGAIITTGLVTAANFQVSTAPTANSTGTVEIVAKDANLLTANAGWLPFKRSDGTIVYVPYWL